MVKAGELKDMQALCNAMRRYHATLPAELAYKSRSLQHGVSVLHKLSDELQLEFRWHCQNQGIKNEMNADAIIFWLRSHHNQHLVKLVDRGKSAK